MLVVGAWCVNLVHKTAATLFGGSVTVLGLAVAYAVRRGWVGGAKTGFVTPEAAERAATQLPGAVEILTVEEALDMRAVYRSSTLVAMRAPNLRLFQEAVARVRGSGEQAVYLLFVDEVPGLFFPPKIGPSREAQEVLASRRGVLPPGGHRGHSRSGAWPTTRAPRSPAPPAGWAWAPCWSAPPSAAPSGTCCAATC